MNTWASQSTSFPKGVFSLFQRTLFLFINWNCRQLGRSHTESTDTCQQDPSVFVDTTVISDMLNSSDWLGRTKICTCSLGGQVSMKRSLSLGLHLRRRETITESTLPSLSALLKIYWALFVEWNFHNIVFGHPHESLYKTIRRAHTRRTFKENKKRVISGKSVSP